ncbi:hypothetical protein IGS67_06660 [Flavimobilis sp. GY10621]|uniref:CARDB domain-containing protein n=1 Tax=Flavimobilis rhizosphaerae TaxID=2775421 RepID=A0ABR9DPW4_9MICO|nr:hypothetical protein [Flavimobilis rhizosphaerae]MBD9699172.1 hypothetical protein [Flavimobilis rhizosphaerae]
MTTRMISALTATLVAVALAGAAPAAAAPPPDPDGLADTVAAGTTSAARPLGGTTVGGASAARSGSSAGASAYVAGLLRRTATIADARDDASPHAGQRLVKVVATQDVVGQRLRATLTFAGAPSASQNSLAVVWFGEWSGSTCVARAVLGVEARPGGATTGQHVGAAGSTGTFPVTRSGSGTAVTLTSAAASTFRHADLECAYVVVQSADGATRYQSFYAEKLEEVHAPRLEVTGGEPVQGARAGRWTTLRLKVHNKGQGDAQKVRISAKGSGLTIKSASRSLGTVTARSNEAVVYKVRLKGAKSRKVTFTVTSSNGSRVTKSFTIAREPAPRRYSSLAGRFFWGYQPSTMSSTSGWDNMTMRFLNRSWVYIGDAKGRTPSCSRSSTSCKRYTYDARRGIAKIGSQKFKVTTKGFSYKVAKGDAASRFEPATLPKRGTRLSANLVHQNWSGSCLLQCTTWTERLVLTKSGKFVRSRTSLGSWPGLDLFWSSTPPSQRGTYKITRAGVIEMRYANGKKKRQTIAVGHDVRGIPSAASGGIVIGLTNFYHQD